jgi:hypothetical protein
MKPFDLKAALRGEKVVTRDGREVSNVTHFPVADTESVIAVIEGHIYTFTSAGLYYEEDDQSIHDLFMATKTVTMFCNIYRDATFEAYTGALHETAEDAKAHVTGKDHIAVATVTWEA